MEKGVTVNEPTHFFVDCTEAGPGDIAISLTDDKGTDVPVDAEDNGEGLFRFVLSFKDFRFCAVLGFLSASLDYIT